jgi:hypothetical protein
MQKENLKTILMLKVFLEECNFYNFLQHAFFNVHELVSKHGANKQTWMAVLTACSCIPNSGFQ